MDGRTDKALRRSGRAMLWLAGALCLAGCPENEMPMGLSGESQAGYLAQALPATTPERAYDATIEVLSRQFSIISRDPVTRQVETAPQFVADGAAQTGTIRILSSPSDTRRIVHARIGARGETVTAHVQVLLQRRDTAQHAAYHTMTGSGDVPNETPIQQGMGLPPSQREVWTTVRRDIPAERELLDAITGALGLPADQPKTP